MSARCERARQWVSAELDGRLSEFEQALLAGHLETCDGCAAFRVSAFRITDELRSAPFEELERPISVIRMRRRFSLRIAPAVAALAVTAVGLGSLLASSVVRPGSEVGVERPAPAAGEELSPENGPVNLGMLEGMRRARIAAPSVKAKRLERLLDRDRR